MSFYFFSNINDIAVSINDLLQFKLTQTSMYLSRFLVNSTVGVAGSVADVIDTTDRRAGFMIAEKIVAEAAFSRYEFIKNAYIQHREYLTNDGKIIIEDDVFDPYLNVEQETNHKLGLSVPQQE